MASLAPTSQVAVLLEQRHFCVTGPATPISPCQAACNILSVAVAHGLLTMQVDNVLQLIKWSMIKVINIIDVDRAIKWERLGTAQF